MMEKRKLLKWVLSYTRYNIAMSILASGSIEVQEAADYISSLVGVDSVLFGASTTNHIKETKEILESVL